MGLSAIREKALKILDRVPKGAIFRSSDGVGPGNPTGKGNPYHTMTGLNHDDLLTNWRGPPPYNGKTGCNGFTGWYGGQLGSPVSFAGFPLREAVVGAGKAHAWIEPTATNEPQPGDVLKHAGKLHMDVAVGFDGKKLVRVAAGQGGPKRDAKGKLIEATSFDVLKRVTGDGPYNFRNLEGWVNIDLLFDASMKSMAIPGWMLGWWRIEWMGDTYYYLFEPSSVVTWTRTKPIKRDAKPVHIGGTGTGRITADGESVEITWKSENTEFLTRTNPTSAEMRGSWNAKEPILAWKMSF